jgi:phosphate acetyltransferase
VLEKIASSWIVTNLEIFAKTREAMTEAIFLDTYGSPLLQAAVGLRAEHSDAGRRIEHDLTRAETRSKLEADMRRGGFLDAGLRALLYVLRGEGADERQFNALEALRNRAPESERLPLSQLKDIIRRQATLLRSNEKKAISTISKLLPDDPEARRNTLTAIYDVISAAGELDSGHDSAAKAVELARNGEVEALMKGSLHTDEIMGAVVAREGGIRTSRRISHCFIMDVPGHPDPLIITDAAVNISPTLEEKVDIVQNAIDLANALHLPEARVAVLSAIETVNPKVQSSLEAATLSKMAERGQITGGVVDGPLALDSAISEEAAATKQITSHVAGRANVLVVPDLEAGNMLAKSLSFLAGADSAGVVLGARVPIILTSRADSLTAHLASCAVAALLAKYRRDQAASRSA